MSPESDSVGVKSTKAKRYQCTALILVGLCFVLSSRGTVAAPRTWIGLNADWVDGGLVTNWNPNDEPDSDDEAIFSTANTVNLGSNNTIQALTMSTGIDLSTNGNDLLVDGLVQLTGNSTNLFVGGAASELNADDAMVGGGGTIELVGGTIVLDDEALFAVGGLTINAGGTLAGHGTINFADAPLLAASVLDNSGTLTALSRAANILLPPPAGTLTINGGSGARIDLDGNGEAGAVNVNRNQTLDINVTLADAFNGSLDMFQNTVLDISSPWSIGAGAVINIDNGTVMGIPGAPAAPSTITGGAVTQTGGTLTVVDADGQLIFDAPYTATGGTFTNNGHVTFNANSAITLANFDFDAGEWTVQNNALLSINVTDYDPGVVNKAFDAELTLNNGDISIISGDPQFVMNGALNMSSTVGITVWDGEPVHIGNDDGVDALLTVSGTAISRFANTVTFKSDANVNVAGDATLDFNNTANFDSFSGANNAVFMGAGRLQFNGAVNVNEATTLNMVGGTVDLDGTDAVGNQILVEAPLVINAATLESFGNVNLSGVNVIHVDALSAGAIGSLTVNLDDPNAEWTINQQGTLALSNTNALATLLTGSDVNVNGSLNVAGTAGSAARLDIAGTVNLVTAAPNGGLTLQGGTILDPNTIAGGQINGPGELQALGGRALAGRGTIHAPIDFDGTAELVVMGGTLAVNGGIVDVGIIRVSGAPATLNFGSPYSTVVSDGGIVMSGGTLEGSAVTTTAIDKSIRGAGTVTSQVFNGGGIEAQGGTLLFTNASSDWDGGSNAGHLRASGGGTLHLVDNATFGFTGSVIAVENSRVFAEGFALDFNPGSVITLDEATYESTSSTDIAGTVIIGAGAPSTMKVMNNFFLSFETGSATTLNSDLRLTNNNIIIEAGAGFSGPGAVVIPDGSHVVAENLADIGVLLDLQGAFRPGNSEGVGRVDLLDYQQADTGELFVELRGTALNAFDRLVADGDVVLDGYLNIDIDEVSPGVPFVPSLGNTFNIITGNTVTGQFDYADVVGMPAGLAFHVEYLSNAVQLQVVSKPIFSADFDDDGDVDATDLSIWRGAFDLNQLGDADGDNDSDGEDFLLWQQQFGSLPGAGAALGAAVPEPVSAFLLLMGLAVAVRVRSNRLRARNVAVRESGLCRARALSAITCIVLLLAHCERSYAQTIDMSLNLQYTMPSDPAMGGNWTLVAKTNSANGIASINAILSNINAAGIAYQSGIGAALKNGNPFVTQNGTLVEVLYAQDLSNPVSVVTDVGRGAGSPGNLAIDPFSDPAWNNAAVIATGTFGDTRPAFTTNLDTPPDVTKGNVLATKTPPFFMAAAGTVTVVVRDGLSVPLVGDYNDNGTVDAADYVVWRHTLTQIVTPSSGADGNGNGTIDNADYDVWRSHFGKTAGGGAGLVAIAAIPEPGTLVLLIPAAAGCYLRRRRASLPLACHG
jgi:hypothetical protein